MGKIHPYYNIYILHLVFPVNTTPTVGRISKPARINIPDILQNSRFPSSNSRLHDLHQSNFNNNCHPRIQRTKRNDENVPNRKHILHALFYNPDRSHNIPNRPLCPKNLWTNPRRSKNSIFPRRPISIYLRPISNDSNIEHSNPENYSNQHTKKVETFKYPNSIKLCKQNKNKYEHSIKIIK